MIRLYYNKRGPLPWSIDTGPNTRERNFARVKLDITEGVTQFNPGLGDDDDTPSAWIEFPASHFVDHGDTAEIW